jgi:G3E family GTPase
MKLHLISGFLGAGKTTTIINCCKMLMNQGKKVAVITNDQGKYLVDTAFMRAADIPAVDVQSGCFCSHYQDMVKQLKDLQENVNPDVVFAEAIGSAANLVGTVMQPLIESSIFNADSLSAVVDARLMLRLIRNEYLPFSDSVTSTFKAQIRESNYLLINKIDIVDDEDIKVLHTDIPKQYPGKVILFQDANNEQDLAKWYHAITTKDMTIKADKDFDFKLHSKALEKLKWKENALDFSHDKNVFPDIINTIETILSDIKQQSQSIAHLKAFIEYEGGSIKISITALDKNDWKEELKFLSSTWAKVIINQRLHL